jgi:ATP-dependent Clp protease ATP-binding subunit ClpC
MARTVRRPAVPDASRLIERDLTALAREGRLDPAYGIDGVVSEVLALISGGGKSPLLSGETGVGKTAIVQEVARRIVEGRVDPELQGARVVELSLAGIRARAGDERRGAEALEAVLEHAAQVPKTVVYVRDVPWALHSSLLPVLLGALRGAKARFIFEGAQRPVEDLLRADEMFAERVHLLAIQEPPPELARWILGRVAEELERQHGIGVEPAACDMALRLATRFLLARRLPRKAIDLLREAAAEDAAAAREAVTGEAVLRRFCAATRLPRFVVDDALPLDLDAAEHFFDERVLGQSDAVSTVLRAVALLKAGLNDPRRPLGAFLFVGPTGVGKTHLAKLLAEFLFGAADRLVRVNMADYPNEGDESILFGQPWGPTEAARRGELTRLLNGKPFAVLLLDEFEKSHASCHDRFLQLFDEGRFINAAGETVACANTLIVATSNVGAEVYREPPIGFAGARSVGELTSEVDRRVAAGFRAELLNRFDAVCHFHPLNKVSIRKIAQREVGRVLEREGIRVRGLDVEVAPEVVDLLVERGYSPLFGARFLQREIEKTLTTALAVEIARRRLPEGTPVRVYRRGDRVLAQAENLPAPREATERVALPEGAALAHRRLDRRALIDEALSLGQKSAALASAAGRTSLEGRRAELLKASQAPNFWDDPARAADTLRAYRGVEARLADLDRLSKSCSSAIRLARSAKNDLQLAPAARAVEEAAREIQLAEARAAAGGPEVDEAVVDVCATGATAPHGVWVGELAQMYASWASRRGYEGGVVAEGDDPFRAVLRISGPGVLGFLAGERGLHRRIEGGERLAAVVRVRTPWTERPAGGLAVEGRDVKRRGGRYVERIGAEAVARDDGTGRTVTLSGSDAPNELKRVAGLLLALEGEPAEEARRYFVGRAARVEDPRTGAGTPRLKDVLRGELDVFIAAWIARPPAEPAVAQPLS